MVSPTIIPRMSPYYPARVVPLCYVLYFILIFPLIAVHTFLRITCYSRRVESTRSGCSKMITINRRWGGKEEGRENSGTRGSDHRWSISSSRSRTHLHLVRLVNTYGTRTLAPFVSLHRAADPISSDVSSRCDVEDSPTWQQAHSFCRISQGS